MFNKPKKRKKKLHFVLFFNQILQLKSLCAGFVSFLEMVSFECIFFGITNYSQQKHRKSASNRFLTRNLNKSFPDCKGKTLKIFQWIQFLFFCFFYLFSSRFTCNTNAAANCSDLSCLPMDFKLCLRWEIYFPTAISEFWKC